MTATDNAQHRLILVFKVVQDAIHRGDLKTARRWLDHIRGAYSLRQHDAAGRNLSRSINQLIVALDRANAAGARRNLENCRDVLRNQGSSNTASHGMAVS
jgi:hypothetical protein